MPRFARRLLAPALPIGLAAVALAGCTDPGVDASGFPVAVTATDTECILTASSAPSGTVTFRVTNQGAEVTEFYVYAPGDRIVGEVENITPGVTRELTVEMTEPGTFETACKPGMTGEGIRSAFTVTDSATDGT